MKEDDQTSDSVVFDQDMAMEILGIECYGNEDTTLDSIWELGRRPQRGRTRRLWKRRVMKEVQLWKFLNWYQCLSKYHAGTLIK